MKCRGLIGSRKLNIDIFKFLMLPKGILTHLNSLFMLDSRVMNFLSMYLFEFLAYDYFPWAGINLGISVSGTSKWVDAKFESDFLSAGLSYGPKNRPT